MLSNPQPPPIDLPKGWQGCIQESWRYRYFVTQSEKDVC